MLPDGVGSVAGLQAVARGHEEFVADLEMQPRTVDMDEQIVLQQGHLQRSRHELRGVVAMDLPVQREQDGHAVLEVLPLDVLLGLLDALTSRARPEHVHRHAERPELRCRVDQ